MACDDCLKTNVHSGNPTGKTVKCGDIDVYVVNPTAPSNRAILFITDIFGVQLPNNRLLADKFASAGFHVYLPDWFEGESIDYRADMQTLRNQFMPFIERHGPERIVPIIKKVMTRIREDLGAAVKIAAVGYCWGGMYAIHHAGEFAAIATFHPSRIKVPEDIEPLTTPSAYLLSERDQLLNEEVRATLRSVLEKKSAAGYDYVMKVYPDTDHGYAVRGREDVPHVVEARNNAWQTAVEFFTKHM